jgi:Ca-activated chloride channel family protein
MIIITDGEAHDESALQAAQRAADNGIVICCIGIGSLDGTTLKINGEYVQQEDGKYVVTKLNETLLQGIAEIGDGIYAYSSNEEFGLESIMSRLDDVEKAKLEHLKYVDFEEQYQWFLGAALLLLILEMLIFERRNPLLRNVKLFERNDKNK